MPPADPDVTAILDDVRAAVTGESCDDALGYVEMRREVLGPNDPLAVLADTVIEVRKALGDSEW